MSQGKRVLPQYQIFTNADMSADVDNSANPTSILLKDNVGYFIKVTGTDATSAGTFHVFGGIRHSINGNNPTYEWSDLGLAIQPVVGANLIITVPIIETFLPHIYLQYKHVAGPGVLNAWVSGKAY